MSDVSEKPFEATPHRIIRAKREGNVARSSEFAANLSFAAAGLGVAAIAPAFGAIACSELAHLPTLPLPEPACALIVAVALLPVGCAALAGTLAGLLQTGGLVIVGIAPKLERLNPVAGFKRIASRETLAHSLRSALAFACATLAMTPVIGASATAMLHARTVGQVAAGTWKAAEEIAIAVVAVGLSFSIAEYGAARRAWLRTLRMSFEERKREAKEEEGDPHARGRRRAIHRALLRSGLRRVKDAAFVVVNPAHVAVALEYRLPDVPVPRVLVRAVDELALRVRRIARRHRIPIVENIVLARALYCDGRTGELIPHVHYVAVAEVVAALLRSSEIAR